MEDFNGRIIEEPITVKSGLYTRTSNIDSVNVGDLTVTVTPS